MGEFGCRLESCRQTEFPAKHHSLSLLSDKTFRRFVIRLYLIALTVSNICKPTIIIDRSMNEESKYILIQLIIINLLNMLKMSGLMFT